MSVFKDRNIEALIAIVSHAQNDLAYSITFHQNRLAQAKFLNPRNCSSTAYSFSASNCSSLKLGR